MLECCRLHNGLKTAQINTMPFKIAHDDCAENLATENINQLIKLVAQTITKTSLSDKLCPQKSIKARDPFWQKSLPQHVHHEAN